NTQASDAGTYRVVVRNANGATTASNRASLSVNQASTVLIDDGQPGYSDTGWINYVGDGYGGSLHFIGPGSGANTATWQATGLAAGTYEVQLTWSALFNRATNATYQIYDGSTLVKTVTENQQVTPSGPLVNNWPFQSAGTVPISSGTLKVVLSDKANNY